MTITDELLAAASSGRKPAEQGIPSLPTSDDRITTALKSRKVGFAESLQALAAAWQNRGVSYGEALNTLRAQELQNVQREQEIAAQPQKQASAQRQIGLAGRKQELAEQKHVWDVVKTQAEMGNKNAKDIADFAKTYLDDEGDRRKFVQRWHDASDESDEGATLLSKGSRILGEMEAAGEIGKGGSSKAFEGTAIAGQSYNTMIETLNIREQGGLLTPEQIQAYRFAYMNATKVQPGAAPGEKMIITPTELIGIPSPDQLETELAGEPQEAPEAVAQPTPRVIGEAEELTRSQKGEQEIKGRFLTQADTLVDQLLVMTETNPEAFGAAGALRSKVQKGVGALQDLATVVPGFAPIAATLQESANDILSPEAFAEFQQTLNDPDLERVEILQEALAIMYAASLWPTGRVPVSIINTARAATELRGFKGTPQVINKLNALKELFAMSGKRLSGEQREPEERTAEEWSRMSDEEFLKLWKAQ